MNAIEHKHIVSNLLSRCAEQLLERGMNHDAGKISKIERDNCVVPVWEIHQGVVKFGSDRHKELIRQLGVGWEHHKQHNDHHVTIERPICSMDLFQILEMVCDWIAVASVAGNDPVMALDQMIEDGHPIQEQIELVIRNTLKTLEAIEKRNGV